MEQSQNLERGAPISVKQRHKHIMGKLQDAIFATLSASNPTGSVSQATKSHIERQLHEFFPRFGTPSHPPYALMIRMAITTLNEERGSTEESISGFIEKEYEDLPWGHAAFLSHHLRKLCGTGEIVGKSDGRYIINVDGCDFGDKGGMALRMNIRQGFEATVRQIERPSLESNDENQNNLQNQQLEVTEEPNHFQTRQFEVSDRHTLGCGQQTIVIEDQGMPQELQIEVMNEKKTEDQVLVTISSASETIDQSMDCNDSSFSLKETRMQLPQYDHSWPVMEEGKKDYLKVGQRQQLRNSLMTERASNTEVIEGQKLVREQEDELKKQASQPHELRIEVETKLFGLCCYNGYGVGKSLRFSDAPLLLAKEEQNKSLKLKEEQQQATSTFRQKQFMIVCGLPAQKLSHRNIFGRRKALNSHLDSEQQKKSESRAERSCLTRKLDADTTMSVLPPSDQVHDAEQQGHCQPEGQGQGRPSKPEGGGDYRQGLRIYFRRRHRE